MPETNANRDVFTAASPADGVVVATIRGEIDLHNSAQIRTDLLAALQNKRPKKLILNLQQVPYMDSSAIAILVEMLKEMRKSGGKLLLVNLQPRVRGLLEIARLDAIFTICRDEAEALAK
ncbi:MAG TPA: STAS domain-containing protein [Tepidisphaeraceae bacterium]|nr:STAS domain-containing protein [Tepidisphaeraceae bacterium]